MPRLFLRSTGIIAIVAFWAVMWLLLLRSELHPDASSLRSLPLSLVLRQYFQHEQASELFLHTDGQTSGHLRLLPKQNPEGPLLHLSGNAQFTLPGYPEPQRSSWETDLQFDPALRLQHLDGDFTARIATGSHPQAARTEFSFDSASNRGWYRYLAGGQTLASQSFTLDQAGISAALAEWGIGPEWTRQIPVLTPGPAGAGAPEITARQSRYTTHGEQMDTFQLALKAGGQTWIEATISQIGQVLEIKTLWGWELEAE